MIYCLLGNRLGSSTNVQDVVFRNNLGALAPFCLLNSILSAIFSASVIMASADDLPDL